MLWLALCGAYWGTIFYGLCESGDRANLQLNPSTTAKVDYCIGLWEGVAPRFRDSTVTFRPPQLCMRLRSFPEV